MEMAEQSISAFLRSRGIKFQMQQPLLIVCPSNRTKRLVITMFKPLGATPVRGTLFARHLRRYIGAVPADRTIVRALLPLVIEAQPSAPPSVQSGWLDHP